MTQVVEQVKQLITGYKKSIINMTKHLRGFESECGVFSPCALGVFFQGFFYGFKVVSPKTCVINIGISMVQVLGQIFKKILESNYTQVFIKSCPHIKGIYI